MKFFGVEVEVSEIREIYEDISGYFKREEEQICMGLKIANENIEQWHRDIVNFFGIVVMNTSTYGDFYIFTNRTERVPIVERSLIFFNSPRIRNFKNGIFDPQFEQLSNTLASYEGSAVGHKVEWLDEAAGKNIEWSRQADDEFINVDRRIVNKWTLLL